VAQRLTTRVSLAGLAVALLLAGVAGWFGVSASNAKKEGDVQRELAEKQRVVAEQASNEAEHQRKVAEDRARELEYLSKENGLLANLLREEYLREFRGAALDASSERTLSESVATLLGGRSRYEVVSASTGVPWYVIGILHGLEASYNWNVHLHNGDSLQERTVHVPKGRPLNGSPPFSWEESAIDALRLNDFVNWHDWSVGGMIVLFERYNGLGYRKRGLRTPYVWGCTDVYRGGAYVAGGHFDPNARSPQCGAAALLRRLIDMGVVQAIPKAISTQQDSAKE
jgi:lysozyme family protein